MPKPRARLRFHNRAVMSVWPLLCAALFAPPVFAQGAPRPEQLIKWRQSAYQTLSWHTTRLKTLLAAGSYDASEARAAANALAAVAASGLPSLFAVGTDKGRGWRETTAATAAFSDAAGFRELSEEFARDASRLAALAAGRDPKPVREQFLKVAQACKGCHKQFRHTE